MRGHLRSELYDYLQRPWLAPASADEHPLTAETIRERIRRAKERTQDKP